MSGLHLLHFFLLATWGGVVAAEMAIEFTARRNPALGATAARFHYWIDMCVEGPLLIGVLATGALLLQGREIDTLLLVKIAAGLGAILANLYCVGIVILRHRSDAEPQRVSLTQKVFLSFYVGFPLAMTALALGLYRAGWIHFA